MMENKRKTIKETLKQNKWGLLISSIVILLPIIAGVMFWKELPEQMATHWGVGGDADGWSNRVLAVFAVPVLMVILHWVCILVTLADKRNREQNKKALRMIFWITPMVSLFANATIYATAFGKEFSSDVAMVGLIGLMFVVIGNYLPKCKHNYTLGIKVKWALENEENWNATHRFGGKAWVIGGLLMMVSVFLPETFMTIVVVGALIVLAVLPIFYSCFYYKKQCKEGTAVIIPMNIMYKRISGIIVVGILILVIVLMFSGNITYEIEEDFFKVKATYWSDMTVDYDKITNLEYREEDEPGSRTSGFGSPRLLMGSFQNGEFGFYTRYSYTKCDSCIVIEMGDAILVISGKNEEKTREIYEELIHKVKACD